MIETFVIIGSLYKIKNKNKIKLYYITTLTKSKVGAN